MRRVMLMLVVVLAWGQVFAADVT
ncbi:hypothetical protein LCGC14_2924070, partial [marine sediment metagenome]